MGAHRPVMHASLLGCSALTMAVIIFQFVGANETFKAYIFEKRPYAEDSVADIADEVGRFGVIYDLQRECMEECEHPNLRMLYMSGLGT